MQIRLLGPVDIEVPDGIRPVSGLRRKAVLAALALHPGEVVSRERLVDIVWGAAPPPAAGTTLQSHLSHLRRVLGDRAFIVARAPGYMLALDDEATDVQVAERLIRLGAGSPEPDRAVTELQAAIALWRGRSLADLAGLIWFDEQSHRLDQLLRQARHALVDARLALGQHIDLIAELHSSTRQDPHDEQAYGQLMLALYRSGRQGDALATYQKLRRALDEDLGIGPSRPLRELEAAILRQDPALDTPAPSTVQASLGAGTVPAQLPLAPAAFTGRTDELARLDRLLVNGPGGAGSGGAGSGGGGSGGAGSGEPAAVVISAVSGTAGIGKTALAIHWAHRVAALFPDGQLYVNLRGFDPSGSALDPAEALRGFLEAFGLPVHRIPQGLPDQAALYRSLIAGKRVLVLLDNARDAEQVRPLLPGMAGSLAIVTSRNQLTGLVASEGAHPLTLDLPTRAEARDLLGRRLGPGRVTAEPKAVDEIVTRCARLPLALAITAARAAARPDFPLAAVAAELGQATGTLDVLHSGDPATDVRAVFSWSLDTLSPDAGRIFRLLGLHPGPDFTAPAAASLAAVSRQRVRGLLSELTRANLLTEHVPGRYTFHDLLRGYATEQAHAHDSEEVRHAATHRLLDHYLHTAHTAALGLNPLRVPLALPPPHPGVDPEHIGGPNVALAWFTVEQAVLLAVMERAAAAGLDTHTWQLASTIGTYLLRQGHWPEHITVQHAALDATRRLGNLAAQADILHDLARAYNRSGRLDDGKAHFQHALDLYTHLAVPTGQAHNHLGLAEVAEQQGRLADSLRHNELAAELFRTAGDRGGEAHALNGIGWTYSLLGDFQQALTYCMQAVPLHEAIGDREGEAATWDSLGCIHRGLANFDEAVACHQRAIDRCRDIGERYWEADSIERLGDTHAAAGDPNAARESWREAMEIFAELDDRLAERVRAKLQETPPPR